MMEDKPFGLLKRGQTFDERGTRPIYVDHDDYFLGLKKSSSFAARDTGNGTRSRSTSISSNSSSNLQEVMHRRYFGREVADPRPLPLMSKNVRMDVDDIQVPESTSQETKSIVIVDTFSTGAVLAYMMYKKGYKIICVLSADLKGLLDMVPEGLEYSFAATFQLNLDIPYEDAILSLIDEITSTGFPVHAVIPGAETGVELADQLSEKMGLTTNGTRLSEARRDKYIMGETIRNAGLRAVRQLKASVWFDIENFISEWNPNPFRVIVKPVDSAGSDDVTLCQSIEDVQKAFGNIMGKINGLGIVNEAVLVQEYLQGKEYVVDAVSKDGVHKICAIWVYDRRPANGAGFVCFGQRMLTMGDDPCLPALVDYQLKVITALGIRNGPTHGEVKWFNDEPVLVEVGSRCHGGDGLWVKIADECMGYNQAQLTCDVYSSQEVFDSIPPLPVQRKAYAAIKWLVNTTAVGILKEYDPEIVKEIKESSCYRGHQFFVSPGEKIRLTQNCFTWGGSITMCNTSSEEIENYYSRIEELERTVLFNIDTSTSVEESKELSGDAIAIVDPFSTGAAMAAMINERNIQVIAVYSKNLEQLASLQALVPKDMVITFAALVGYKPNLNDMIKDINNCGLNVLAVIAGAETGVELADALSERMGLRTNGSALSEARRNKYVMGETIRAAGVRAVKQLKSSSWHEIEAYVTEWNPNPFKVIVKPVDSAGSDGVTLCHSISEIKQIFEYLIGRVNGLGATNSGVLVQEYLEGQEYVIDAVSKDGVHKIITIWAYDRRAVNGAGFVCFGQRLLCIDDDPCLTQLVEYQKKVITALGIRNGPTHGEVKWFNGEPVLVEVGARCHGAEGSWIQSAQLTLGYNQAEATVDVYLNGPLFDTLPDVPYQRQGYGKLLFLVNKSEPGILREINVDYIREIESMEAVLGYEIFLTVGNYVSPTIDCFSWGGMVKLFHKNSVIIDQCYNRMRDMEDNQLFITNPCPLPPKN